MSAKREATMKKKITSMWFSDVFGSHQGGGGGGE